MRRVVRYLVSLIPAALVLYLLLVYLPMLVKLLLVSISIAYVLHPSVDFLTEHGLKRRWAAAGLLLMTVVLVVVMLWFFLPVAIADLSGLGKDAAGLVEWLSAKEPELMEMIMRNGDTRLDGFISDTTVQITAAAATLPTYVLAPVLAYYFLVETEFFLSSLRKLVPSHMRKGFDQLLAEFDSIIGGYVKGQLLLSLLITGASWLILVLLQVRDALPIALINGAANLIPYFGPLLGLIPAVAAGLSDSIGKGGLVLLSFLLLQQFEGNILSPRLTGRSIDLHPVHVILLLVIGEELFGVWGLLFSVPVGGILRQLLTYVWSQRVGPY